jgi:hypothetical protein
MKLSFLVCVNDAAVLERCLLRSPCLLPAVGHQLIVVEGARSAAEGFARGRPFACNEWIVMVHQDVVLPENWDKRFASGIEQALQMFPETAVVGVFGVTAEGKFVGHVNDRGRWIGSPLAAPVRVRSLDELLFAVRTDSGLKLDPRLGFHLYATDLILSAEAEGFCAVAVNAPCSHLSALPEKWYKSPVVHDFLASTSVFEDKWKALLPVITTCGVIDGEGWLLKKIDELQHASGN